MDVTTIKLGASGYPQQLSRLHKPPAALYIKGRSLQDILSRPRVAVVGSRAMSPYGKQITRDVVKQLVGYGVVIVSGLAYGIDAEAHRAALDCGGITLAVLPSPLQAVAPAGNKALSENILAKGGALLSTYPAIAETHKGNFVERNEYVAALSQAVIVIEAGESSGARHTVDFAAGDKIGIPSFAVPGNLGQPSSVGTNNMISSNAAALYTTIDDVLEQIGIDKTVQLNRLRGDTPDEQRILDLIVSGVHDGHVLLEKSGQDIALHNQTLTMLEIAGKIRSLGGNQWGIG